MKESTTRCHSMSCFALRSAARSAAVFGNVTTLLSPPVVGSMASIPHYGQVTLACSAGS